MRNLCTISYVKRPEKWKHLCLSFVNAVTLAENMYVHVIIGASLSKPHISGTALQDAYVCQFVCLLAYVWPYTEIFN